MKIFVYGRVGTGRTTLAHQISRDNNMVAVAEEALLDREQAKTVWRLDSFVTEIHADTPERAQSRLAALGYSPLGDELFIRAPLMPIVAAAA